MLRLPGDLLRGEARHDGYLGTLSHRAQVIPVFSIASLLGTTTRIEEGIACVLLFREGRQLFGAVVDALEEVARCQPFGPPEEKMLRRPETGAFVPLFDLQTEIAITALDTGIALP
ncbi:chemotaxis protein CheW [Mameliella sp. AT18]|nr:chemotaxis protein CheW [Mameliella sp. AT18]MDD9731243.1 chemotaxis protein CheW [Mameliella sp. AT18]